MLRISFCNGCRKLILDSENKLLKCLYVIDHNNYSLIWRIKTNSLDFEGRGSHISLDRTKITHESHLVSHSNLNTSDLSRYVQFNCEETKDKFLYNIIISKVHLGPTAFCLWKPVLWKNVQKNLSVDCLEK